MLVLFHESPGKALQPTCQSPCFSTPNPGILDSKLTATPVSSCEKWGLQLMNHVVSVKMKLSDPRQALTTRYTLGAQEKLLLLFWEQLEQMLLTFRPTATWWRCQQRQAQVAPRKQG